MVMTSVGIFFIVMALMWILSCTFYIVHYIIESYTFSKLCHIPCTHTIVQL